MKHRIFEVQQIGGGTFRFLADSKELAIDHVWQLNQGANDDFPKCIHPPVQIGWTEDYAGLNLDDELTWR